jgi:hypothetical protein
VFLEDWLRKRGFIIEETDDDEASRTVEGT